jgi:hypothetical protein
MSDSNVFNILNSLDVNAHTEKKKVDGKTELTYLSWPWAWAEVKKRYPDAHYEIKRGKNGLPYSCDPYTGYMVFTSVTIEGITHDMWLPVMDGANNAMKQSDYVYYVKNPNFKYAREGDDGNYYDKYGNKQSEFWEKKVKAATMFDVNKAIMRCLVKNLAMFGLGLYIYAGEDLPECERDQAEEKETQEAPKAEQSKPEPYKPAFDAIPMIKQYCEENEMTSAEFTAARDACINAKLLPRIAYNNMTEQECLKMIEVITMNRLNEAKTA